jgi:hypothetical protein
MYTVGLNVEIHHHQGFCSIRDFCFMLQNRTILGSTSKFVLGAPKGENSRLPLQQSISNTFIMGAYFQVVPPKGLHLPLRLAQIQIYAKT